MTQNTHHYIQYKYPPIGFVLVDRPHSSRGAAFVTLYSEVVSILIKHPILFGDEAVQFHFHDEGEGLFVGKGECVDEKNVDKNQEKIIMDYY